MRGIAASSIALLLFCSVPVLGSTVPERTQSRAPRMVVTGVASYYGNGFRGKATASGERYDPEKLTAAHRSYPLGTRVRVTNLKNGRSAVVRINDRGPYKAGRKIDLSVRAARELRLIAEGITIVTIQVIG